MERNKIIKAVRELLSIYYEETDDDNDNVKKVKLYNKEIDISSDLETLREFFLQACEYVDDQGLEQYIPDEVSEVYNELVSAEREEELSVSPVSEEVISVAPPKGEIKIEEKKAVIPSLKNLEKEILSNKDKNLTNLIDYLILKPVTLENLLMTVKAESEKRGLKSFKNLGEIKAYLRYVEDKKRYILENKDGKIRLIGVNNE